MLFRIQTLYLFLIFVLISLLFMQNPLMNELSYTLGGDTYQEFTQIWSSAFVLPDAERPYWETNFLHLACVLVISICSVVGIFIPRKTQWQFYLACISLIASVVLLFGLMVSFRSRQNELGANLVRALETPHMLWFALLFAFELTILRNLWVELREQRKSS